MTRRSYDVEIGVERPGKKALERNPDVMRFAHGYAPLLLLGVLSGYGTKCSIVVFHGWKWFY